MAIIRKAKLADAAGSGTDDAQVEFDLGNVKHGGDNDLALTQEMTDDQTNDTDNLSEEPRTAARKRVLRRPAGHGDESPKKDEPGLSAPSAHPGFSSAKNEVQEEERRSNRAPSLVVPGFVRKQES
ncbi:MAG TPA: hypothetical protein DCG47_07185, partial [Spirochaetaceae bacterium]|nr:hypothetical protein [Spirochaetaceae bacterium]